MKKIFLGLFPLLYLLNELIGSGGSIDKITYQFLYINVINFVSLIVLLCSKIDFVNELKLFFSHKETNLFGFTVLFLAISVIFAINKVEAIIVLNQFLTFLFTFFISITFFKTFKIKNEVLIYFGIVLLCLELFSSLSVIFEDIIDNNLSARSQNYKGVSSNINILSFALLAKFPFCFILINRNLIIEKIIGFLLIAFTIFNLIILSTRAAFIGLFICLIIYTITELGNRNNIIALRVLKPSLLIIIFSGNLMITNFLFEKNNENRTLTNRAASIVNTDDSSISLRLGYYKDVFESVIENPQGIGVGNWKIISIKKDKERIKEYIVPYHAHNDFLQITAEGGIIAGLCYLFFWIFSIRKSIVHSFDFKNKSIKFYLFLLPILVYCVDSSLNFPIARPINVVFIIILISFMLSLSFNQIADEN